MLGLAKIAVNNTILAALIAGAMLLFSVVPVLMLGAFGAILSFVLIAASGAVLALVMLRHGIQQGLQAASLATLFIGLISLLLGNGLTQVLLLVLLFWLPVLLAASVLRQTVSLSMALMSLGGLACLAVALLYLFVDDPAALWKRMLDGWTTAMQETMQQASQGLPATPGAENATPGLNGQQGFADPQNAVDMQRFVELMSEMMTGGMAASLLWVAALGLLLARSWQAKLFNPGGFQTEFHRLSAGRTVALAGLVICVSAMLVRSPLLANLATVVIAGFLFQGIAVVHSLVKTRGMSQGWLIGMYLMLMLLQTSLLLGALGIADNWLDIRRLKQSENNN